MIRSVSSSQDEILASIQTLHCPEGYECDITYGNGGFWKNLGAPKLKFDIQPLHADVQQSCSTKLPLSDITLNNVVFDPPFLTYIKAGRNHNSMMARRFGGYWTYDELSDHYKKTLDEVYRILKPKGKMIFKCQDMIHNHQLTCTHVNVINWAAERGFRLRDFFILAATHRATVRAAKHGVQTQQHARIYHSYFLVLEKRKIKQ